MDQKTSKPWRIVENVKINNDSTLKMLIDEVILTFKDRTNLLILLWITAISVWWVTFYVNNEIKKEQEIKKEKKAKKIAKLENPSLIWTNNQDQETQKKYILDSNIFWRIEQ